MPFSHSGRIAQHPQLEDHLEVSHTIIRYGQERKHDVTFTHVLAVPKTASRESLAATYGEVARLSLLAAMKGTT